MYLESLFVLLVWSFRPILTKKTLDVVGPLDMTLNYYAMGGVLALVGLTLVGKQYNFEKSKPFYPEIALVSVVSLAATMAYYKLMKEQGATQLTLILNPLNIIVVALASRFILGEKFNNQMWLGTAIVVVGLFVFLKGKSQL